MHHRQLYLTYQGQQYRLFYKKNKAIIRRKTHEVCITDNCTSRTKRNNTGYFTNKTKQSFDARHAKYASQTTVPHVPSATKIGYFTNKKQSNHSTQDTRSMHHRQLYLTYQAQQYRLFYKQNKAIIRRKTREVCITDNCTSRTKRNKKRLFYNKKQSNHSTQDTGSMHHRQLYLMYQAQQYRLFYKQNKAIIRRKTREVCITDNCTSRIKRNNTGYFTNKTKQSFDARHEKYASQTTVPHVPSATKRGYFTNKTKQSFDARHGKYASQTTVPHVSSATIQVILQTKQSIHSTQDTRSMHHKQLYLTYQAQQK